jgi:hypothetical protein
MTLIYILSNIEKFSGIILFNVNLWIILKNVAVEILLTYVAFDSFLVAWKDHKKLQDQNLEI